jgi:hypothetical protein
MISGQQGMASIEAALREIEAAEAEARRLAERDTGAQAETEKALSEGYRDLARVQIDFSLEDGVIDRADGLTAEVMKLLSRWQEARNAAETKWQELKAEIEDWRGKRHAVHDEVEQARQAYDRAIVEAKERLGRVPAHGALVKAHAEAMAHIENARAKARKAEAELAEKKQPYAADPLFMYLWNRHYGTPDYAAGAITRMLDGWVARQIRYHDARMNYAALTEIPARLNQYVARLEESAQKAEDAIHANVQREAVDVAKEDLASRIASLEADLAVAEEAVTKREAVFDALSDEVTRLAQGQDPNLEAAVEKLARVLESTSFRQLVEEARRTRSDKDDRVLARIQNAATLMQQAEGRAAEHRQHLDSLAARRSDLLRIAAEFRRQRYDDSSSVFTRDEVFSVLLRQMLAGAITAGQYWTELQRHQSRQRRASDRVPRYDDIMIGGGMSWPRFPGSMGGGGSWGGSGGSGGGGSGGFRTGGSF